MSTANAPAPLSVPTDPAHPAPALDQPALLRPRWKSVFPWLIAFAIACGWDRATWLALSVDRQPLFTWLEELGNYQLVLWNLFQIFKGNIPAFADGILGLFYFIIYQFGRIFIWIILALFFIFRNWASPDPARARRGLRLGVFVILAPALAGILAELLKILSGRLRPELTDGFYRFALSSASPLDPKFWNTSGKGLASSHCAFAVAAALAAGLLLPRLRPALWFLAILCCLSRVLVGAHFLSDMVAGIALGVLGFKIVYAWDARNNRGVPIDHLIATSPDRSS